MVPLGTSRVTPSKGSGPPIWENHLYIEVNGVKKVKSDTHVAMNKNSDPVHKCFLTGGWVYNAPNSHFSKLQEFYKTSRARKLILGLQVNIDKAYGRRYNFIL